MPNSTVERLVRPQDQPISRLLQHLRRLALLGLLFTLFLVGLATSLPMFQQQRQQTDLRADFDVRVRALASSQLLDHMAATAMQLTSRSEIRRRLEAWNAGELDFAQLQNFTRPRLLDPLKQAPDVFGMLRLDARGEPVVALRQPLPRAHWSIPPPDARQPLLSGPLYIGRQPVILVGAPIRSSDGQRAGSDIVAFSLDDLRKLLPLTEPYAGDPEIHLLNRATGQAVHVHTASPQLTTTSADHPLMGALGQLDRLPLQAVALPSSADYQQPLIFAHPLPGHPDWVLVLLAESSALYAGARRELLWPLLGILLLSLAGGLLTYLTIRPLLRRMLEQAQSLKLAASVYEHSNEGILLLDAAGHIMDINPAGCRLLHSTPINLEGQPLDAVLLDDIDPDTCQAMWQEAVTLGGWQREVRLRRCDGDSFSAWLSLATVYDEQHQPTHFTGLFTDISQEKAEQERMRQMAYHDRLTGLPNRSLARDRLAQALRKAARSQQQLAVLFLDLDRFKPVNDTWGHAVGDLLLQEVAIRLIETLRAADTVARLGGDEFLIILEELADAAQAEEIAGRLTSTLQQPFETAGHQLQIGASIGIALYPDDGEDADLLVRHADAAMYQAKANGRNCHAFHAAGSQRQAATHAIGEAT